MSIIFLDIDGVLCTERSCVVQAGLMQVLDPVGVQMLRVLLELSQSKLVLSSSWRHHHDQTSMTAILQNAGLHSVPWHQNWKTPTNFAHRRGIEIDMWMIECGYPEKFLILDDDVDILDAQKPYWVKTSMLDGISFVSFMDAKKILGIA